MENTRILAADDNPEICEIVRILLEGEGFAVDTACDGPGATLLAGSGGYDLVILDVMMPGLDGYAVCQAIRRRSNVPILFLSARTQDADKLRGLSSGGDDYLSKPFSADELVGRVKALLRRYQVYRGKDAAPAAICIRHVSIDPGRRTVLVHGRPAGLTDTEYAVLLLLARNRGQIFPPAALYEAIWKEGYYAGASNTVMVHIRNLRKKIEDDPKDPQVIRTIWGKGYTCDP